MREGKITLPALYVLRESTNPILLPIKEKLSKGELLDEKEIHSLISISVDEGGIDYAKSRIEHYKSLAIASIPSDVPACLRDALVAYLEYTISRKK